MVRILVQMLVCQVEKTFARHEINNVHILYEAFFEQQCWQLPRLRFMLE